MNTPLRRVLLAITAVLGLYVGIWAQFFPEQFYTSFPGLGLHWIDIDGPLNEHLIRDVGSAYLGLSAASLVGMLHRSALPGRVAGVAWGVFGVLHFGYHALHPEGTAVDIAGTLFFLGLSAAFAILLALPSRSPVVATAEARA
jgi:hypothetical protein